MESAKFSKIAIFLLIFLAVNGLASENVTKILNAKGTVVDSTTGVPIPNAMVLLIASPTVIPDTNNLDKMQVDTTITDANGKFVYNMTVENNIQSLICVPLKQGYATKFAIVIVLFTNTADFQTIKIVKSDNLPKDTLTFNGLVVDSASGLPISGATIFVTSLLALDTTGNTVLSNTNGTFSKQVIIPVSTSVIYGARKQDYTPAGGRKAVSGKVIDLGTIKLAKAATFINRSNLHFRDQTSKATSIAIYSLNGQLIFAGSTKELNSVIKNTNTPMMIHFMIKNIIIAQRRVFPAN